MPISQIPQILEHIDLERWDRPAALVRLVAALQDGPNPVPLGRKLLEATGRNEREAHYDHEVMLRLAERDRVLMRWRGTGRRPDSWSIADLARWRHVPWITPRRDVIAAFSSPLPDAAVALWSKRAAQAVALGSNTPILEAISAAGLSVNLRTTTPRPWTTTPRDAGTTPPRLDHNATAGADPYCSLGITPPSSSYRADDDDGKRRSPEAARLIAAVRSAVGCGAIWGAPAAQLAGLVDEQPERTDWLCQLASRIIPGTRSPARAVILLREAIAAGDQPGAVPAVDVDRRRRNLVDLIATYRTLGEDSDRVAELESQLADLGATYDG